MPATTDKHNTPVVNAMTVDVEDYFQVSAFEGVIDRGDWDRLPARVEHNTHRILDLFADHGVQATFFTLGWVAERYPQLVRRIVESGHELASHGLSHVRVTRQIAFAKEFTAMDSSRSARAASVFSRTR